MYISVQTGPGEWENEMLMQSGSQAGQPSGNLDNAKYKYKNTNTTLRNPRQCKIQWDGEDGVSMEDLEKMFSGFPGVFQVPNKDVFRFSNWDIVSMFVEYIHCTFELLAQQQLHDVYCIVVKEKENR